MRKFSLLIWVIILNRVQYKFQGQQTIGWKFCTVLNIKIHIIPKLQPISFLHFLNYFSTLPLYSTVPLYFKLFLNNTLLFLFSFLQHHFYNLQLFSLMLSHLLTLFTTAGVNTRKKVNKMQYCTLSHYRVILYVYTSLILLWWNGKSHNIRVNIHYEALKLSYNDFILLAHN